MSMKLFYNIYNKDYAFFLIVKICSNFMNVQTWLFMITIPLISAIGYLIYKESNSPILSFIMFIALNFYEFLSFSALRQALAVTFIILAYFQIKDKKIVKFLIFVMLGSLFHQTALLFLVAYPLSNMKIGIKQFIIIIFGFLIANLLNSSLMNIIFSFITADRYQLYISKGVVLNHMSFYINCCIVFLCYYIGNKKISQNKSLKIQYNMIILGTFLSAFTNIIGEFYRLSMYFSIFEIILLPNMIQTLKDSNRKIVYVTVLFVFIIYFFIATIYNANIAEYKFFWQ